MITQSENGLIISGINIYILSVYSEYFITNCNYFMLPYDWIMFGHIWNLFFLLLLKSIFIFNNKQTYHRPLSTLNVTCKTIWNLIGWNMLCFSYSQLHIFVIIYMSIILALNSIELIEDLIDLFAS